VSSSYRPLVAPPDPLLDRLHQIAQRSESDEQAVREWIQTLNDREKGIARCVLGADEPTSWAVAELRMGFIWANMPHEEALIRLGRAYLHSRRHGPPEEYAKRMYAEARAENLAAESSKQADRRASRRRINGRP
jgi:hypothetical protein